MNNSSSNSRTSTPATQSQNSQLQMVPDLSYDEMNQISEETMKRYSLNSMPKRKGKGVGIVWFRNDLRVLDNEALFRAWVSSQVVLPVYCVDPTIFNGTTHHFGFPKTGALRTLFLIECLDDLKKKLMQRGLNLLIQHGKPEEVIPLLVEAYGAHTVYAHKETCSEELNVERLVKTSLLEVKLPIKAGPAKNQSAKLELIWGSTMYHVDDLPFDCGSLPDVYTQFRKNVESKSSVRSCIKIPTSLGPPPDIEDWGRIPVISELGSHEEKMRKGMRFVGGETAALTRVHEYFWKKDLLRIYKETRNGMLGPDYSTKFSPWLASGSISPRVIYEEAK